MLSKEEHLLMKLSEECIELSKELHKAALYGMEDMNPTTGIKNIVTIKQEFIDMMALVEELREEGIINLTADSNGIGTKQEKLHFWMEYARSKGKLEKES